MYFARKDLLQILTGYYEHFRENALFAVQGLYRAGDGKPYNSEEEQHFVDLAPDLHSCQLVYYR